MEGEPLGLAECGAACCPAGVGKEAGEGATRLRPLVVAAHRRAADAEGEPRWDCLVHWPLGR